MRELERQQKEVINLREMCIKKESIPINVILFVTCPNILTIEVQKLFIHDGKILHFFFIFLQCFMGYVFMLLTSMGFDIIKVFYDMNYKMFLPMIAG